VERLRRQFPSLTDDDVDAYVTVTRRILSAPAADRARVTHVLLTKARAIEGEKRDPTSLSPEDLILLRYLTSLRKIQRQE
jgi:hypothetical protein